MERRKPPLETEYNAANDGWDLDSLLHPAQAFEHPTNVVNDPDLTLNEKRAILASWASDACAIEAAPDLRRAPGSKTPVRFDDVIDALRALDRQAQEHGHDPARYHRVLRSGRLASKRSDPRGSDGQGPALN